MEKIGHEAMAADIRIARQGGASPRQDAEGHVGHADHFEEAQQLGLVNHVCALERELQHQLFESDDAKEGIAANLEKRTAHFNGR